MRIHVIRWAASVCASALQVSWMVCKKFKIHSKFFKNSIFLKEFKVLGQKRGYTKLSCKNTQFFHNYSRWPLCCSLPGRSLWTRGNHVYSGLHTLFLVLKKLFMLWTGCSLSSNFWRLCMWQWIQGLVIFYHFYATTLYLGDQCNEKICAADRFGQQVNINLLRILPNVIFSVSTFALVTWRTRFFVIQLTVRFLIAMFYWEIYQF